MPVKRQSSSISFHTTQGDFESLDAAILEAARSSLALGGKYTDVNIYAHSRRAARDFGGPEAADKWDDSGQNPLATIKVKVGPISYW